VSSEGPVEIGEGVMVWEKGVVGISRNGEGGVGGLQEEGADGDDEEEREGRLWIYSRLMLAVFGYVFGGLDVAWL